MCFKFFKIASMKKREKEKDRRKMLNIVTHIMDTSRKDKVHTNQVNSSASSKQEPFYDDSPLTIALGDPEPTRNFRIVYPNKEQSIRNINCWDKARDLLYSCSSRYCVEDLVVVLVLALNEEKIMTLNEVFWNYVDEIQYIKIVSRWEAVNKPTDVNYLEGSVTMK